jgi:hypothetical protein
LHCADGGRSNRRGISAGQPASGACLPGNLTGEDALIDLADFDEFVSVLAGP